MRNRLAMMAGMVMAASVLFAGTAMAEGENGRIAVVRNMASSDHTAQFFKGCTEEGEALGYSVDTFMSDGDDVKMQDLMTQAINQGYDIMVVSHANEGYQYDLVSEAVEKGIKVVGFDCGGDHVEGVTYTTQDDASLTKISLDALLEKAEADGAEEPVNIIEVNTLGAIVPFDTRHSVVEEYVEEGKINVVQLISPSMSGDYYTESNTGVSAALANNPDVQGIWTASTAFLDGIIDAVKSAGRDDVVITGIDISDTEVQRLAAEPNYYCCAAVDPYVIGVVDTRIAISKALGLETPEEYKFNAVGIMNTDVKEGDTMASLAGVIDGFGSTDEFSSEELEALRK